MRKDSILKTLGITFLVVVLLSWVIPAGIYSNGTYTATGSTLPIGLYDIVRIPILTIATFIQYGLLFLAIGGFYGVLNETKVYSNLVSNIAKKWDKSKKAFLIITVIVFSLLTSLTGLTDLMILLVPFFVTVLLKLGYNKVTALTSTIGSILVGNLGSTLGFNIWGYLTHYLSLNMTTLMFARAVLLIMAVTLLIISLLKTNKNMKKTEEINEEIPLFEENKSKKSSLPLIIVSSILFVLLLLGGYNWYYSFKIEVFNNLYEAISSFEIAGYPLFNKLLSMGSIPAFGFFQNYDITIILIFFSLLIGWLYNVKVKDIVKSFAKGSKEILVPAIYATLSCTVFACILNASNEFFINTIVNKFIDVEKFSFMGTVGTSLVTSFAYNDFQTVLTNISPLFVTYDSNVIPTIAFIIQGMFGIVSLLAPTSIYLIFGLSYMDISYKEWIKHIWKYALVLFGIILVVAFILTTLI